MNIRHSILLVMAILAMASYTVAETAPSCKTTCSSAASCASASTVSWTSDDAKQIRVEVVEEDGVSKVKVFEMKDGEEVLVKEYETDGDPNEMLEFEGGDGQIIIMSSDDGDINTWTTKHGDNDAIRKIMKIKGGDAKFFGGPRAYLGIEMEVLNEQLAEYFGGEGVLVKKVIDDSPAAEVGLKAGDVIVSLGGEDIDDAEDVYEFMGEHEKGDEVEIKVLRKGKDKSFKVTLTEQDGQAFAYAFGDDNQFSVRAMPHLQNLMHGDGDHEVLMRRFHGGESDEMENLRADVEELRAMLEELKEKK